MAVFTSVSLVELSNWITQFPLGQALAITSISTGIENSNFFIETESGEYVLTLFEKLDCNQLSFYLELMCHLAKHNILVPIPIPNHFGSVINTLNNKPAVIVTKLQGKSQLCPTSVHCYEVGIMLAKMHLSASSFKIQQSNLRSLSWWCAVAPILLPFLSPDNQELLSLEIKFQQDFFSSVNFAKLPTGPIHADLFRDNVMFLGDKLTGFFDFYFAGCDTWLFDLAVTVNDWCINTLSGKLDVLRLGAMLRAYSSVRPFTSFEKQAWPAMLRAAALRFWLSRLYDLHLPRPVKVLTPHDPTHFERILRLRIHHTIPPLDSL